MEDQGAMNRRMTIVIADHPAPAKRLQMALHRYGIQMKYALNDAALSSTIHYLQPDCIVLDMDNLQQPDGYHLCGLLTSASETIHIPIIMLSSRDDRNAVQSAFEAGAYDYLLKTAFVEHNLVEVLRLLTDTRV
jgi:PleD family two-component response regulator